ncbi:hypothetical protein [Carnimonas bestiolae]|uniref:hypothetical protein n=1 Tax=Carnimonas bestiolae TaxID=3402172 RepID=UPI003EDBBA5A
MSFSYFKYIDSKGNLSLRKVDVVSRNSLYLSGYCYSDDELIGFRTFRRDRIADFLSDSEFNEELGLLPAIPPADEIQKRSKSQGLSILFTGFKRERKHELEFAAVEAGLVVKKSSVSKSLDFICGGYNAGPSKLKQADEYGIVIFDEASFLEFLITGEVPLAD